MKYIYTAKSSSGETKGGEVEASNEKAVAMQLRSEGMILTSLKAVEEKKSKISVNFLDRFMSVPLKEKMVFARNLSVMISSGLTISRALNNQTLQVKNKTFKNILAKISTDVQEGKAFSDALARYPSVFNELFVNMVKVGETGGNLEEVLNIVASQMEKEHDLISKVRGALTYPAVIIVAMIGIAVLMLTYVLPKITGVFKDMDVVLPPTTRFIIGLSDFFKNHSILVILIFIFLAVFIKLFYATGSGKKFFSLLYIKIPVIKNIVIKVNCARFARIYSSLIKSGVSVIDALGIISRTLGNYYYKTAVKNAIEQIQKGVTLSKAISQYPDIFPPLVFQMMEVGEETGKTDTVLMKLAQFYEEEVDQITKNMSSIIEPVLMIFIGGAVGFFAVSMLQPMYSLMENIK